MTEAATPKGGIFKEAGSYLLAAFLMIVCYFLGNLFAAWAWDVGASYDHWNGPLNAAMQTAGELLVYGGVVSAIPFLSGRHVGVPPIIGATIAVTVMALSVFLANAQGPIKADFIFRQLSAAVNLVGWAGFGFVCLRNGKPEL
jgi:hypothetical protein